MNAVHLYRGLLYKDRSSTKTDSLLANRSSVILFAILQDIFANIESVYLFLYSSPQVGPL